MNSKTVQDAKPEGGPPEKNERLVKIEALNERLRSELIYERVQELILRADATDAEIERAETALLRGALMRETPDNTPDRQNVIRNRLAEARLAKSPIKLLRDILGSSREKQQQADAARALASAELERAVSLQLAHEKLVEEIADLRRELTRARGVYEGIVAHATKVDSDDEILARWTNRVLGSIPPHAAASLIDAGQCVMIGVESQWLRVKKILETRIAEREAELSKIESL